MTMSPARYIGSIEVTGDLQRIDAVLAEVGKAHRFVGADRKALFVEEAVRARARHADDGDRAAVRRARPASRAANSSQLVSAAASAREMLSVDGQRGLPSAAWRLDLLKVVGSSPAARARPDAVRPLPGRQSVNRAPDLAVLHGASDTATVQDFQPSYRKIILDADSARVSQATGRRGQNRPSATTRDFCRTISPRARCA